MSHCRQKLAKKLTHFTIRFHSKNTTHFMNLNPLSFIKNILLQHSQKRDSNWCQKKHFHCTIYRLPRAAFSKNLKIKCVYISVNHRQKIFVPETKKLLSGGELNNFFQAARCLRLVKCFEIIILIEIFGNSTIFQHFNTSANIIETLKFSRQIEIQE